MVLDPPLATPLVKRLAVIGIGLIGSSILHAAKTRRLAGTTVASDASEAVRQRAAELGLADEIAPSAAEAVKGADLVIICVPVGAMAAVAAEIGPYLEAGAIVSDVGSVKGAVLAALKATYPDGRPHHPGASGGGHRIFRPGCGLCDAVPESLVHPHPAGRRRCAGGGEAHRGLDGDGRQCRDHERRAP